MCQNDILDETQYFFEDFLRYADRMHPAYLTLQCQKEGSMGERSKPALC